MQCEAKTSNGERCQREAQEGEGLCWQHGSDGTRAYSNEEIIAALREYKGMVHLAAEAIGCSHTTIYNRAEADMEVRQALAQEQGRIDDVAELKLYEAIQSGEAWAIKFRLQQGQNRPYKERQDVTTDDEKVDSGVTFYFPQNNRQRDDERSDDE